MISNDVFGQQFIINVLQLILDFILTLAISSIKDQQYQSVSNSSILCIGTWLTYFS